VSQKQGNPKTVDEVREALLSFDSTDKGDNYFPNLLSMNGEQAYKRLFDHAQAPAVANVDRMVQDLGEAGELLRFAPRYRPYVHHIANGSGREFTVANVAEATSDSDRSFAAEFVVKRLEAAGILAREKNPKNDLKNTTWVVVDSSRLAELIQKYPNSAQLSQGVTRQGGINLDSDLMDMQIKRDGKGVVLPISQQPASLMRINGLMPFIIRIEKVDMPMLLGKKPNRTTSTELSLNR
jgi:hypothetical protein